MKKITQFFSISLLLLVNVASAYTDSLSHKIGQMFIVGFQEDKFSENSDLAKLIRDKKIGGLIFFNLEGTRNIKDHEQLERLTQNIRAFAHKNNNQGIFLAIDMEGGVIDRFPRFGTFPFHPTIVPRALGDLNDPKFTYTYSRGMAEFLEIYNFNLNFAPVVDIEVNPVSPVIGSLGRSFSASPKIVTDQAEAFIKGFHQSKIMATLKHFPGHGSVGDDSHNSLTDITETWKDEELVPFQTLIKNGFSDFIMIAHVVNKNLDDRQMETLSGEMSIIPATFSKKLITGMLRDEFGFDGVVISDDLTMGAIATLYDLKTAFKQAVNAGVDMFILSNHFQDQTTIAIETIRELVESGEIPESRIDEANARIQKAKHRFTPKAKVATR